MKEVYLYAGTSIDEAIKVLKEESEKANEVCFAEFNGKQLLSTDTLDKAYIKVMGKTKNEFDKEVRQEHEDYLRKEAEHNAKIPQLDEKYFPELEESEDEKIRKELIEHFEKYESCTFSGVPSIDVVAWLEKQKPIEENKGNYGEISPTEWSEEDEDNFYRVATYIHINPCVTEEKYRKVYDWLKALKDRVQPQSKQEWSDEDKSVLSEAEGWLDTLCDYLQDSSPKEASDVREVILKLRTLKDKVLLKQREWSEEDETRLDEAIQMVEANGRLISSEYSVKLVSDWLKSLSHQKRWKPTKKQIDAIDMAIAFVTDDFSNNPTLSEILKDLQNQLKAL